MADNSVFITGTATGAFTDALDGLPAWATDATAKGLERILRKSLVVQTGMLAALAKSTSKGTAGMSPADAKKLNDELSTMHKNILAANGLDGKQRKSRTDELEASKLKYNATLGAIKSVTGFDMSLAALGLAIKTAFINNVNTFDSLQKSGINVMSGFTDMSDSTKNASDGFQALRQMAVLTGVRYTELAAIMQKYSGVVNTYGTGKFIKTMSAASSSLTKFGYGTVEVGELLGSYLEIQRGYNNVNNKNEAEVQNNLVNFGAKLTKVSTATGMARDAILQNMIALSHTADANLLSATTGVAASESTMLFISSLKNQKLGRDILAMMTDVIKPLNETFSNMQSTGDGAFAQMEMNFVEGLKGLDPEQAKAQMAQFAIAHEDEISRMLIHNKLLAQSGMAEAKLNSEHLTALRQEAQAYKAMKPEERARQEATSAASKKFKNSWEEFSAQIQMTFAPMTSILDTFTFILGYLNTSLKLIGDFATSVSKWIGSVTGMSDINITKMGEIAGAWGGLAIILGGVFASWRAAAGIKSIFGKKGSRDDTDGQGSNRSSSSGGRSGSGRNAGFGDTLSGLGRGLAGLGKGIGAGLGGLISGILQGIGTGLTALGTRQVLFGIVNLGLASASVWVLGKALQAFATVEWESLGKAGAALLVIGAAAAIFGAAFPLLIKGAVVMGVFSVAVGLLGASLIVTSVGISMFSTAIKGFGAIEWDSLVKAGAALIGLGAAAAILGAGFPLFVAGATVIGGFAIAVGLLGASLMLTGGGFDTFGKGISTISDSIDKFTGISKLKDIVSTINELSLAKTLALAALSVVSLPALAVTAGMASKSTPLTTSQAATTASQTTTSSASNPAATSVIPEKTTAPGSTPDISGILSYQTTLLDQLLLSTNKLVSVNEDILRYARTR